MADVGNLTAKLTLDTTQFDKETSGIESKVNKLSGGITASLGKVAAGVGAAVAASAAAVGKAVYDSVNAFAEYEQLVGGSKLVFGDAYDYIMDKAVESYKTVQMSQNEYIKQVNGFAVGLRESLGGNEQAAAELADRIVNAEADVVAAMGVTQESVQNAFNGIMKSNYTMVDNLMLGIKPTKEGFQEMIDKVNEWNAAQGHATQYTMDSLADQQAALVDYIEMQGLAGYASKEAGDTITGSLSMVKAAWQDALLAASGGGKGMSAAIDSLVYAAQSLVTNLIPVLQEALYGIGDLLNGLVPIVTAALPGLVETLLPQLINAAMSLLQGVMNAIPQLVPMIASMALDLVTILAQSLSDNVEAIIPAAIDIINQLLTSIFDHLPDIIDAGLKIIMGLVTGIVDNLPSLIDCISNVIYQVLLTLTASFPDLLDAGVNIILKIAEGVVRAIPQLLAAVAKALAQILVSVVKFIGDIISAIGGFFGKLLGLQDDNNSKIVKNSKTMTDSVTTNSKGMVKDLNGTANEVASIDKNILSSHNSAINSAQNETKTFTQVTTGQLKEINKMSNTTADVVKSGTDKIHDSVVAAMTDLDALDRMDVRPEVDASNVISECNSIVSAVERAISALNSLPSGGGGSIPGFASGGDYSAGKPFIAGELGPELIVPRTSGHVYTASETEDIFGRGGYTININGDVYDDERSMTRKLRSAMTSVLEEQMAYG